MTDIIQWGEPPRQAGDSPIRRFVEELRNRPGEWGKYPEPIRHAASMTYHKTRNPGMEFVTRTIEGKLYVWGRFTPPTN